MVSLKQTSVKYRGKKAETYEAIRTTQARWAVENETVETWLRELKPVNVLDCPVGTGRFIPVYRELKIDGVGMDVSKDMLALAKRKNRMDVLELKCGSATETGYPNRAFDMSVCVRFLDLIDNVAMKMVMTELTRVSSKWIICTIRLGEKYLPKSNTAEHDIKKFRTLISVLGFKIKEGKQFREGSWHILLLERK